MPLQSFAACKGAVVNACSLATTADSLLLLLLAAAHPDEVVQAAVGCILHQDVQLLILVCAGYDVAAAQQCARSAWLLGKLQRGQLAVCKQCKHRRGWQVNPCLTMAVSAARSEIFLHLALVQRLLA
jgi:hypothetical protein